MRFVTAALIGLIRLYQRTLSRLLPNVCRFQPSCSEYAVEALQRHGLWRGSRLALRRLAHCHPWHPGGDDPVPESASLATHAARRLPSHGRGGEEEDLGRKG